VLSSPYITSITASFLLSLPSVSRFSSADCRRGVARGSRGLSRSILGYSSEGRSADLEVPANPLHARVRCGSAMTTRHDRRISRHPFLRWRFSGMRERGEGCEIRVRNGCTYAHLRSPQDPLSPSLPSLLRLVVSAYQTHTRPRARIRVNTRSRLSFSTVYTLVDRSMFYSRRYRSTACLHGHVAAPAGRRGISKASKRTSAASLEGNR